MGGSNTQPSGETKQTDRLIASDSVSSPKISFMQSVRGAQTKRERQI